MSPRPTVRPGKVMVCADCGDDMQSMHQHDFVACKCGNSFVDGGSTCPRMGFKTKPPMTMWEWKQIAAMTAATDKEKP